MVKQVLGTINLLLGIALTAIYVYDRGQEIKRRIDEFAETETIYNERDYVLVKLARGDYPLGLNGLNSMRDDYKFYRTIYKSYYTK